MNPSAPLPPSAHIKGTTKLCVTRHGETDWNITGILQGWTDVPLNDTGRQQARDLAETLADCGFTLVCTSPLRRSAETAEIIAAAWGLPPPTVSEGLKERHFGRFQGMPKSELLISHPGLHQEIVRRNPACPFEEGESVGHFADRVLAALEEIAHTHAGTRVLIITHGWVMDVITRHLRHLPRTAVLDLKRKNGESIWIASTPDTPLAESDAT
ncbi:histidine phosphatase family protein [uncultured Thiodictyon sp.]|uniref:histidine phosphatase family protein n=1 Tax=uncultured Thiodictyon sp. TaxID=1846217 RepID=UPI0025D5E696|nr:histidine phosphatase family protein [uncultured Thiodictyon sp.]